MKIIIPMSGQGSRFIKAGYTTYKPLIIQNGMPVIQHVVNMFPGDDELIFIVRTDLLETTDIAETLMRVRPNATIVPCEPHKLGPVHTATKAFHLLKDDEPVIYNYCDFFMQWDYNHFRNKMIQTDCDGSIVCYTGFHPHLLHPHNLYAVCKLDENHLMTEIREKHSYVPDKTKDYHSVGTYYFKRGSDVKKYFMELMEKKITMYDEYFVSLVYNLMYRDGLKTVVYSDVPHFCQWGTPSDMGEYKQWSDIFIELAK